MNLTKKLGRSYLIPIDNDWDVEGENNKYDNDDNYNENTSDGKKYHRCNSDDSDDTANDIDNEDDAQVCSKYNFSLTN